MLTPYALGTTFAALLYQRGEQLLHGSAVGFHGRVIVLCGPSGRGKSTLAAALCALGGRPVCDDLSRLVLGDRWSVFPDGRRLKLLPAAVAQLGLASHELATVSDGTGKRFVDLDGEGVGGEAEAAWGAGAEVSPWPIAGIVSIDVAEHPGRALLRRLDRVAAVTELLQRTYRRDLHAALVPGTEIARRAVSMAEAVPVYRLERPPGVERVMETAAVVLEGVLG
jgi:serine kinase of HPr protein (carbohydrate metabolism regulator)